jgi:hypothetical protein
MIHAVSEATALFVVQPCITVNSVAGTKCPLHARSKGLVRCCAARHLLQQHHYTTDCRQRMQCQAR